MENRQSPEPLNKDQLLLALTEHLSYKIRASYRSHPFFKFLLSKNKEELLEALAEAEYRCSESLQNDQSKKIA